MRYEYSAVALFGKHQAVPCLLGKYRNDHQLEQTKQLTSSPNEQRWDGNNHQRRQIHPTFT